MGKSIEKTIEELCPMDDVFFEKLAHDINFCEEVLQVILQRKDLKVVKAEPQKSLRNVKGRSVIVDVLCKDTNGNYHNIEIQKHDNDDHQKRVRYNGANVDTFIAEKGSDFKDLPELYVVYISSFDFFGKNRTVYHIDRVLRETGDVVDNGFHEVYVNTQVDDNSEISELMELFKSPDAEGNEKFPKVTKAIKHFKTGKGRIEMCKSVEEYAEVKAKEAAEKAAKAAAQETTKETILRALRKGMVVEDIADITGLTVDEIKAIQNEMCELV